MKAPHQQKLSLSHASMRGRRLAQRSDVILKGRTERISLPAGTVDVVISNRVANLLVDKPAVFAEIYRVLVLGARTGIR
jgi:arsenite methyltransferase